MTRQKYYYLFLSAIIFLLIFQAVRAEEINTVVNYQFNPRNQHITKTTGAAALKMDFDVTKERNFSTGKGVELFQEPRGHVIITAEESLPKEDGSISIYTSRNFVSPGGKVHCAAFERLENGSETPLKVKWSISPNRTGLKFYGGILTAFPNVKIKENESITVRAQIGDRFREKKITLRPADRTGHKNHVYFYRYDNNYKNWNLWTWEPGEEGIRVEFTEDTDFGKLAHIENNYFIIRMSENGNDWKQKASNDVSFLNPPADKSPDEVFIVEGDPKVYRDFQSALKARRPKTFAAIMDSKEKVRSFLIGSTPKNTVFSLYMNNEKLAETEADGRILEFRIEKEYDFRPDALFEIRASKLFNPAKVTLRSVLDDYYYEGSDMGAVFTEKKASFRVWAPTAAKVSLVIFESFMDADGRGIETPMTRDNESGTWYVEVDRKEVYGRFYKYKLTFHPGTEWEKTTYAVDPYAKALGINGDKGAVIDTMKDPGTIPEGWDKDEKPELKHIEDSVIYELHVRDFSMDPDSGISAQNAGKFMAFTEDGTTYSRDSSIKTGLSHLKELGVTHVHLLPVYDFATVDEANSIDPKQPEFNWGYDPKNYNAPEGSYSTDPFDPRKRIIEFRRMVMALHKKDIRLVMDVVYNHTYNTRAFDPIVPGYYYRTDDFGRFTNGSGCGNEVASERPMVRKFIVDSTVYWAKAYRVDGFRFDLMGLIDVDTMTLIVRKMRKIDPAFLLYGEPWTADMSPLSEHKRTLKGSQRSRGFAVFNDNLRNSIRGDNRVPHPMQGYVTGWTKSKDKVIKGITGAVLDFADKPGESIAYVAAHDNYVLWDQIIAALGFDFDHPYKPVRKDKINKKDPLSDERVKRDLLANGIVLTSQGIPFIHAGDEFLRTKFGDHNSYKSSDEINKIRWQWKKDYKPIFDYYQGLIKLRREHPAFRMRSVKDLEKHFVLLPSPADTITYVLRDNANGDKWENIIVIYNPHEKAAFIDLPEGKWTIVVNDREAGVTPVKSGENKAKDKVIVKPLSMMVLHN